MQFILVIPAITIVVFIGFLPIFTAFSDAVIINGTPSLLNFHYILQDQGFMYSLKISLVWALFNTLLSLSLGFLIAHHLNRARRWRLIYLALLVPWGLPVYIGVPIWRAIVHGGGGTSILNLIGIDINLLTDPVASFLAALFVSVWFSLPLTVFVLWGSMATVQTNLVDAAKIDGGSLTTEAFSIYLPMMRPALITMFTINFIKFLKEFTVVFLMTDGGPPLVSGFTKRSIIGATTTLDIFIYDIFTGRSSTGIASAYSVLTLLLVAFVMILWFLSSRVELNAHLLIILVVAAQTTLGGYTGLVFGGLYLLAVWKRGLFKYILIGDIVAGLLLSLFNGFLRGFNAATIISLMVFLILRREREGAAVVKSGDRALKLLTGIVLAGVLIASVLPLLVLVWISLSGLSTTYIDSFLPRYFTLDNFVRVVGEEGIISTLLNTLFVSLVTGLAVPLLTFQLALALRKIKNSLSDIAIVILNTVGVIGGMHTLVPLYSIFRTMGMIDSYFPVVLVYISHAIPFSVFTIRTYLESVPESLEDQAKIDGVGPVAFGFRILLPLSRPVLTTSFIVAFLGAWNGFLAPLLFILSDSKYTMGVKLYTYVGSLGSGNPQWNLFGAAATINLLVMGVIFYTFRGYLGKTPLSENYE